MEDASISNLHLGEDAALFGVFDGHGGKEVSEFVSRHFSQELLRSALYAAGDYAGALTETFMRMDELLRTPEGLREIQGISNGGEGEATVVAGCTAVVALVQGPKVYVANAGDSRCVLCRGGRAVELSQDHKPDNPEEKERIMKAGGTVEEGRVQGNLNLSRSIGDLEYKKDAGIPQKHQMITAFPDIKVESLRPEDQFLVLACDGIWDMLSSQDCVEFVAQRLRNSPLETVVQDLLDRCLASDLAAHQGLGCDNMTAVVVLLRTD